MWSESSTDGCFYDEERGRDSGRGDQLRLASFIGAPLRSAALGLALRSAALGLALRSAALAGRSASFTYFRVRSVGLAPGASRRSLLPPQGAPLRLGDPGSPRSGVLPGTDPPCGR